MNWEPALKRLALPRPSWSLAQIQKTDTNTKIQKSKDRFYLVLAKANKKSCNIVLAHCELKSCHKNNNRCCSRANLVNLTVTTLGKAFKQICKNQESFFSLAPFVMTKCCSDRRALVQLGPTWSAQVVAPSSAGAHPCPGSESQRREIGQIQLVALRNMD